MAAGGVGEVGLDASRTQFDDAARLLVHADAHLAVLDDRAVGLQRGIGRGFAFFRDGVAPAGEWRQVAHPHGQLAAGETLRGNGPALVVSDDLAAFGDFLREQHQLATRPGGGVKDVNFSG